jgi:[acyl-carrier-protein] S-malonyltransferase
MNDACEETAGTMAVVLGLQGDEVEALVKEVNLPNDLWAANFNCPGQTVISGTTKGIQLGTEAAKARGAKRVLPLQVHGAFHSGLMASAETRLSRHIQDVSLANSDVAFVMNVPGDFVSENFAIKEDLIKQVTSPVRWEQGIRRIADSGVSSYIEIGCGKSLSGFNKRIQVTSPTFSLEKVEDLRMFEQEEDDA